MKSYILKKFFSFLFTLWIIITATFFLMKALPGGPFTQEKAIPKEILASLNKHYGLDRPIYEQYFSYLKSVCQGDFGPSFKYKGMTVNDIIADGFPVSALLGLEALLFAIPCGILLGMAAAKWQNKAADSLSVAIASLGISIPSFILAALLQYLFAIKFNLFPVARWGSFSHSVLPALSLGLLPMAFITRLTRSSLIEVFHEDYMDTAKAKGLSDSVILFKHALPNGMIPVVSYLGVLFANVLTGSFVVEKIFGIPGLGQWFVNSVANRDYTVIMGLTIFYSVLLFLGIFFVDLVYSFLNPKIRLTEEKQ